ncbi:MAG: right-handed parallel beta-helix repeat-containing protein, partial [Nitrosomonadaceae bacterium]
MATYYIDPTVAPGGIGTIGDPFDAWPTLVAGNTYSFQGGETTTLTAQKYINVANITINSYGTGKHIFDGTSQTNNYSGNIWITTGAANTVIDNVTITSTADDSSSTNSALQIEGTASNTVIKNIILTSNGLRAHEHVGIVARPTGNYEIYNFNITGFTRGIRHDSVTPSGPSSVHDGYIKPEGNASFAANTGGMRFNTSTGAAIDYNYEMRIYNVEIEDSSNAGITIGAASNVIFEDLYIHGTTGAYAYPCGFILGTPTVTPSSSGSIIRRCLIEDMNVIASAGNGINSRNGAGCFVYSNVFVNCANGIYNASTTSDNNSYYNNTFIDCIIGIKNDDSTTGTIFKNNIVTGVTTPVSELSGSLTYSYNCFDGGSGSTGTDGGGNITTDP